MAVTGDGKSSWQFAKQDFFTKKEYPGETKDYKDLEVWWDEIGSKDPAWVEAAKMPTDVLADWEGP